MKKKLRLLAAIAAVCVFNVLTQAQIQSNTATKYKEKVLHAFTGGSDGGQPTDLVRDAKGNLYGATASGGNMSVIVAQTVCKGVESCLKLVPLENSKCYTRSITAVEPSQAI